MIVAIAGDDEPLETTEVIEARNILQEVVRQYDEDVDRFGVRSKQDGTSESWMNRAWRLADLNDQNLLAGVEAWVPTLQESMYAAFGCTTPQILRRELIEVMAQTLAWITDLDRREWVRMTNAQAYEREAIKE
jgi:hypothetical protein